MLTVTWQVTPLIVTCHLLFGLTTLGLLWWLWLSLSETPASIQTPGERASSRIAWRLALVALIVLVVQIALGGWTSTNYADIACPDFPKCQDAWWPETDFRAAFVLWRGLGVNYEGGVLDSAARVAIHLTHRMGAIMTTLMLSLAALTVLSRPLLFRCKAAAAAVLAALALQLTIGISMVLKGFPLWLATSHTAGAAILLLCVLQLLQCTHVRARERAF
jgi:cytochrome c oxidase assembly protein subunit 15